MPASPKSPQSKKQGAPKAKGAVRAKSGCYTCRIRRKVYSLFPTTQFLAYLVPRNVTSTRTRTDTARHVSVSVSSVSALAQSVPNGFAYVLCFFFSRVFNLHPLQESRNVSEMRDKIKGFLAAQGMIKGHSGSGPRGSEHDSPILRLEEDNTPSSSESPPTPTLSLSPSEAPRSLGPHESAIREQRTSWIGVEYPHGMSL
jgi:hypothetical protein